MCNESKSSQVLQDSNLIYGSTLAQSTIQRQPTIQRLSSSSSGVYLYGTSPLYLYSIWWNYVHIFS